MRGYLGKTHQLSGWRAVVAAIGLAVLGILGFLVLLFSALVGFVVILIGWFRHQLLPARNSDTPPVQWSPDTGEVRDIEVTEVIVTDDRIQ